MATIVYLNPTAAPTNITGQNQNTVVATASTANGSDTMQITHGFGLTTTEIAAGWPTVLIQPLNANASGSNWSIASIAANYVGLLKNNSTASGESSSTTPQIQVAVSRPHSIMR